MTPDSKHMIEFWDSENSFCDLDEPEEYCCKIPASYDSSTPSYARLKIVKINAYFLSGQNLLAYSLRILLNRIHTKT